MNEYRMSKQGRIKWNKNRNKKYMPNGKMLQGKKPVEKEGKEIYSNKTTTE